MIESIKSGDYLSFKVMLMMLYGENMVKIIVYPNDISTIQ